MSCSHPSARAWRASSRASDSDALAPLSVLSRLAMGQEQSRGSSKASRGGDADERDHDGPSLWEGVPKPVLWLVQSQVRLLLTSHSSALLHRPDYLPEGAAGALDPDRIMGVETGGCPHTAIREDASINLRDVDKEPAPR